MDLSVKLPGLNLKNPIIPASGCFAYGREFSRLYDLSILGGLCIKSVTNDPRLGNPTPRIAETPCGMLNAIGLQNKGVDFVKQRELPFLAKFDTEVIANVAGASEDEYLEVIRKLNDSPVIKAYELNISCRMWLMAAWDLARHLNWLVKSPACVRMWLKNRFT